MNRDELYAIADQYGGCICDPAFSDRNREDPQCRFHERRELMDDILAAESAGVNEVRPEEIPGSGENYLELARLLRGWRCCVTPQMCDVSCQDDELSATLAQAERLVREMVGPEGDG